MFISKFSKKNQEHEIFPFFKNPKENHKMLFITAQKILDSNKRIGEGKDSLSSVDFGLVIGSGISQSGHNQHRQHQHRLDGHHFGNSFKAKFDKF